MLELKMRVQSIYESVITKAVDAAKNATKDNLIASMKPHLGVNIQAYKQPEGKVYFVSQTIPGIKLATVEYVEEIEDKTDVQE